MTKKDKKIKFNLFQIILVFILTSVLSFTVFFILFSQTNLKTYVFKPKQEIDSNKGEIVAIHEQILALEDSIRIDSLYIAHLRKVVTGEVSATKLDTALIANLNNLSIDESDLYASEKDSVFRKEISEADLKESLKPIAQEENMLLFPPIRGPITSHYNIAEEHLAVDIAGQQGDPVVASANGNVIFAGWTPDTGYVIILQHSLEMLTVYKHNSKLYKKQGEEAKKGEAIAAVGNTGELTTGPHVHYELWIQGKQVDPESYIDF